MPNIDLPSKWHVASVKVDHEEMINETDVVVSSELDNSEYVDEIKLLTIPTVPKQNIVDVPVENTVAIQNFEFVSVVDDSQLDTSIEAEALVSDDEMDIEIPVIVTDEYGPDSD
jgi:hypothetical protein